MSVVRYRFKASVFMATAKFKMEFIGLATYACRTINILFFEISHRGTSMSTCSVS